MFNNKSNNNSNNSNNSNQDQDHPGWDMKVIARKGDTKVILSNGRYIEVPA